jgi:hypothetical protein
MIGEKRMAKTSRFKAVKEGNVDGSKSNRH